jgi:hypothetical protein
MMVKAYSEGGCRRINVHCVPSQCTTPYIKHKLKKAKEWGMAQMTVHLLSKHETLSSIPSIASKNLSPKNVLKIMNKTEALVEGGL